MSPPPQVKLSTSTDTKTVMVLLWAGSWTGASSPPGKCEGALEQRTEQPNCLKYKLCGSTATNNRV